MKCCVHLPIRVGLLTLAGLCPWPVEPVHALDPPCPGGRPSFERVLAELEEEAMAVAEGEVRELTPDERAVLAVLEDLNRRGVPVTNEASPPSYEIELDIDAELLSGSAALLANDPSTRPLPPERARISTRPPPRDLDEGSEVGNWRTADLVAGMEAARAAHEGRVAAPPPPPVYPSAVGASRSGRDVQVMPVVSDEVPRAMGGSPTGEAMAPARPPRADETVFFKTGERADAEAVPVRPSRVARRDPRLEDSDPGIATRAPDVVRANRTSVADRPPAAGAPPARRPPLGIADLREEMAPGADLGRREDPRPPLVPGPTVERGVGVFPRPLEADTGRHMRADPRSATRTSEPGLEPISPRDSGPDLILGEVTPIPRSISDSELIIRDTPPPGVRRSSVAPGSGTPAVVARPSVPVDTPSTLPIPGTISTRRPSARAPGAVIPSNVMDLLIEYEGMGAMQEVAWLYRRHANEYVPIRTGTRIEWVRAGDRAVALENALVAELSGLIEAQLLAQSTSPEVQSGVTVIGGTITEGRTFLLRFRLANGRVVEAIYKTGLEAYLNSDSARDRDIAGSRLVNDLAEVASYALSVGTGAHVVPAVVPYRFRGVLGTLHVRLGSMADGLTLATEGRMDLAGERPVAPITRAFTFVEGRRDPQPRNVLGFMRPSLRSALGMEVIIDAGSSFTDGPSYGTLIWNEVNADIERLIPERYRDADPSTLPPEIRAVVDLGTYFFYNVLCRLPPNEWAAQAANPIYGRLQITPAALRRWEGLVDQAFVDMFADPRAGREVYDWAMRLTPETVRTSLGDRLLPIQIQWTEWRARDLRRRMRDLRPRPAWMTGLPMPTD